MYRQQVNALEEAMPPDLKQNSAIKIELGTVDSFQGREKDAIIVSVVETNPRRKRFFYDARRLNVALSRGKELLVIIGELDVFRRPDSGAGWSIQPGLGSPHVTLSEGICIVGNTRGVRCRVTSANSTRTLATASRR